MAENELVPIQADTDGDVTQIYLPAINDEPSDALKQDVHLSGKITVDFSGSGKLVQTASKLLLIAAQLKRPQTNIDLSRLRKYLTVEINAFNIKAKHAGLTDQYITLARYCICATLDEFVLDTPWGANSNWSEHSLLNTFHQDSAGGAKFFAILEKLQQNPQASLDNLQLMYICLGLGFVGKYRVTQGGIQALESVKFTLFDVIRKHTEPKSFFVTSKLQNVVNLAKPIPLFKLIVIVLIVMTLAFTGLKVTLDHKAKQTITRFNAIVLNNAANDANGDSQ